MTITERDINIFDVPGNLPIVHCVSNDYVMNTGISLELDMKYSLRDKLFEEPSKQFTYGHCIPIVVDDGRYIFNLVTKDVCHSQPSYGTFSNTINDLKLWVNEFRVSELLMTKLGCDSDGLMWEYVKPIIEKSFWNTDVKIVVCSIPHETSN